MKLHVSACNGHRQVSTTTKKILYIYSIYLYITRIYRIFLIVVETWPMAITGRNM